MPDFLNLEASVECWTMDAGLWTVGAGLWTLYTLLTGSEQNQNSVSDSDYTTQNSLSGNS